MTQTADSSVRGTPSNFDSFHVEHTRCTDGSSSGLPDRPGGLYPLRVGVTMSIHKLTAGSGYDYLTRQVAALDATEKGHTGLASYYTERGETPGVWTGSGLDGIGGLATGDPVTAEQMRALFGCGLHPLAELRQQQLEGPDLTLRDFQNVALLGAPFKIVDNDLRPFRVEVAKRIAALNTAIGWPADASIAAADRARVRTQVARQFFLADHGREPTDARELAGQIAKDSRPRTQTVAGYDLTFSPVKSVSTLWAVADPAVAAAIERDHQAAVRDALAFIEKHALFTRTGPQGIRQVNVRGLVATAFTHRDSRAGDPDLHTHVAVANKVQGLDGRWLSIDGRVLFKANVAASETYNTALEQHLRETLGVRFAERPGTDPTKRPIREIVGVDPRLNRRWSTRRTSKPAAASSQSSSNKIMAGHRPQSKRCIWHNRRHWRPATPNTNPDP
jgi:conjugative relaxase-like TrwC/TraI family protein